MRFLPKGRWGLLGRATVAAFIVIACAAGATAVAALLQVKTIATYINATPALKDSGATVPKAGQPQTLLLIGADRRSDESTSTFGNTDTMLLVRINDSSQTINVLSIPRDLEVTDSDGGVQKLNAVYSDGGSKGLVDTIRSQVFPGFKVNHIIIVSFDGFAKLINDIGCVYAPVDQRYYNHNDVADDLTPGYADDFSDIDIYPGYQKMCGDDAGAKSALAFVRFRHTDTDLIRNARQQDFLRWAKDQFNATYLEDHYDTLAKEFGKNAQSDNALHDTDGLLNLFGVLIHADGHQVKTIKFPEGTGTTIDGGDFVTASSSAAEASAYREFMKPTEKNPTVVKKKKKKKKHHHKSAFKAPAGMVADPTNGQAQSQQLGNPGIPIYYPKYIPEAYGYCFSVSVNYDENGNCDESSIEPTAAYNNSYPRRYNVIGPKHRKYKAWVMTLLYDATNGEGLSSGMYFNVQGLQWKNPPLLRVKHETKTVNGKKLLIYSQGGVVTTVAWRKAHAVYWIQNTLVEAHGPADDSAIPNEQMIAMAATLTPYQPSLGYGTAKKKHHKAKKR